MRRHAGLLAIMASASAAAALSTDTPTVYEISTRPWLYELSLRYGRNFTLGQVPAGEWAAIADKGAQVVWLMGVWQACPGQLTLLCGLLHVTAWWGACAAAWAVRAEP